MAILWIIYTIVAAIILREPKRTVCRSSSDASVAILSSASKRSKIPSSKEKHDGAACDDFHQFVDLSVATKRNQLQQDETFCINGEDDDLIHFSDDEDDGDTVSKSEDTKNDLGKVFIEPKNNATSSLPKFSSTKVCLLLTFLTLFISEIVQSSTPLIGYSRFGWSIDEISTLSFFNLILRVPMSIIVGWLSQSFNDRKIVLIFFPIALLGLLFLIDFTDFGDRDTTISYNYYEDQPRDDDYNWLAVNPIRYSVGNIIVFTSLGACSSISASTMSKVLAPEFAKGTYNASFLTTLVG